MPPFNAPSWKRLTKDYARDAEFGPPTSEGQIVAVEQALGIRLPTLLREFLLEADGVTADYGSGVVWSAADIQKRNQEFRSLPSFRDLYMPFDHLLFFGDDGGGDQFAFAIHADGQVHKHDVFRWEHETDARSWFAGRLERFLETRLKKEDDDDVA
jgi:hypothetical protein